MQPLFLFLDYFRVAIVSLHNVAHEVIGFYTSEIAMLTHRVSIAQSRRICIILFSSRLKETAARATIETASQICILHTSGRF